MNRRESKERENGIERGEGKAERGKREDIWFCTGQRYYSPKSTDEKKRLRAAAEPRLISSSYHI